MLCILTTNPGIEDIVDLEVKEKFGANARKFMGLAGRVLVDIDDISKLLKLRSIYHIIKYVGEFEFAVLEDLYKRIKEFEIDLAEAKSFRVTSNRIGSHNFTSIDIQRVAGEAIVDKYHKKVDLENYDVDIICDVIGYRCIIGIKVTREFLHKRFEHRFVHPATIKAPLAYAMLRLSSIDHGLLLDPFCGGGTIAIEAARIYDEVYASDINARYVEGAKKNAEAANANIKFKICDARELDRCYDSVDVIVTNPPYGIRMGKKMNLRELYKQFLNSASKVIDKDGKIVLITRKAVSFRTLALNMNFYLEDERVVGNGDIYPHIFVLRKL